MGSKVNRVGSAQVPCRRVKTLEHAWTMDACRSASM